MLLALLVAAIVLLAVLCPRQVTISRIVDGDSLEVRRGRKLLRVRIAHMDAPEYKQPGGRASLRYLEGLLVGRTIRLCFGRQDIYGRRVARVLVNGTPVDWLMVRAGHAWPDSSIGVCLSLYARIRRRGIWNDPQRLHPSHWRKLYAHRHPGLILD